MSQPRKNAHLKLQILGAIGQSDAKSIAMAVVQENCHVVMQTPAPLESVFLCGDSSANMCLGQATPASQYWPALEEQGPYQVNLDDKTITELSLPSFSYASQSNGCYVQNDILAQSVDLVLGEGSSGNSGGDFNTCPPQEYYATDQRCVTMSHSMHDGGNNAQYLQNYDQYQW